MTGLQKVMACLAFCTMSAPASAVDPITLFLLRMLRDQTISSTLESGVAAQQQASKPESVAPSRAEPPVPESQWLKDLIDESFVHLDSRQREELHASLMKTLADPANASIRADILAEFTRQAIAMRDARRQLSRLTEADMQVIAAEARSEFERLPADQRKQLLQALQQGLPGMPRALQDRMLAEFSSVPPPR